MRAGVYEGPLVEGLLLLSVVELLGLLLLSVVELLGLLLGTVELLGSAVELLGGGGAAGFAVEFCIWVMGTASSKRLLVKTFVPLRRSVSSTPSGLVIRFEVLFDGRTLL